MVELRRPFLARAVALLTIGGALASCTPSVSDISMAEAMMQIGDVLNAIREENAMIQAELDSLRSVVARQDTLIRRIGDAAGVPIPR